MLQLGESRVTSQHPMGACYTKQEGSIIFRKDGSQLIEFSTPGNRFLEFTPGEEVYSRPRRL